MSDKDSVLAEHKENVRRNRMVRSKFWKWSTLVLLVIVIIGGVAAYNGSLGGGSKVDPQAVDKAVAFINENMLGGLATAELVSATEENGLYKVELNITTFDGSGQSFVSYVTQDGTLLFPSAIDISDFVLKIEEEQEVVTDELTLESETEDDFTGEPVRGNAEATVTIVEYADFECPFCGKTYWTMKLIEEEFGERVRFVYKNFPLDIHDNAQKAAEAGECALDQGKFWEFHDKLYENQNALSIDDLKQYAVDLGLDTDTFNACVDSGEKADEVAQDLLDGKTAGVTGTPTFIIGDETLVGAKKFEDFKAAVERQLAAASPAEEESPEEPVEEGGETNTTTEEGNVSESEVPEEATNLTEETTGSNTTEETNVSA